MMIELHRASRERDPFECLRTVDLRVQPGEKIVISGPEGCGKKALLSLLAGMTGPEEGMIRFTSDDVELSAAERKERIRLIPPGGGLWGDLTVWENLYAACRLYGMSGNGAEIAAIRVLEACGLTRAEDIRFGKLPPDWKVRTALAAAAACGAEAVFASGLTEGLKTHESRRLFSSAERIFGEKTTVVVCEENPSFAEAFGKRFLIMKGGRIVFDGTGDGMKRAARRTDLASAAEALGREAEG